MANKKLGRWGTGLLMRSIPLAAGVYIYVGDIVVIDVAGYGRPRASAALVATDRIAGISNEEIDNTAGAAGALSVSVDYLREIEIAQSATDPVLVTDRQAYVEDTDHACCLRTTGLPAASINVPLGEVLSRTSTHVRVLVGQISAADISNRVEVLEGY